MLSGFDQLINPKGITPRQLLRDYAREQPASNQVPWNPVFFFNRRLVKYILHQSKTIGFYGKPSYPTGERMRLLGAGHLPPVDFFTLCYYEYGGGIVWENKGRTWPLGVITADVMEERLRAFTPFEPYEARFLL